MCGVSNLATVNVAAVVAHFCRHRHAADDADRKEPDGAADTSSSVPLDYYAPVTLVAAPTALNNDRGCLLGLCLLYGVHLLSTAV